MSIYHFLKIYEEGSSGALGGAELLAKLESIDADLEVVNYIISEIRSLIEEVDPSKMRVLLKAAYIYRLSDFAEPISQLLQNLASRSDDEIYTCICEIEFSFTVLGLIGCESALPVLELYSTRFFHWDDLFNINKAAMYAIAGISGNAADEILEKLNKSQNESVRYATLMVLERRNVKCR
ncbi:hypothetical protein O5O45_08775 [Hahella aquimaris]|uniref:hypothetical protein n=1 Tax=Hahella sp. HNIBRBA332 TaxID=3015983 RepID=UPI00273C933A|nr:hypothetical protein [Hahella sp. HNIBRBA332]WLQ16006.1 hypothetical protein O5O45_08775 [Hahella sp. HNIBRBA332]